MQPLNMRMFCNSHVSLYDFKVAFSRVGLSQGVEVCWAFFTHLCKCFSYHMFCSYCFCRYMKQLQLWNRVAISLSSLASFMRPVSCGAALKKKTATKKRGKRKLSLLFPLDLGLPLNSAEICQWPAVASECVCFLRQSRENKKTNLTKSRGNKKTRTPAKHWQMCSAKQSDFDVFAGKTEVTPNKNVKFCYPLWKLGNDCMLFIVLHYSKTYIVRYFIQGTMNYNYERPTPPPPSRLNVTTFKLNSCYITRRLSAARVIKLLSTTHQTFVVY